MSNINGLKKGIGITFIAKYSNIIIQLIINSILARLLGPREFGIIAVITVFISFFTILGDMGLGPAIIQNKSLKDREISDIFKFSVIGSVIGAILFYFFSYLVAYFYSNEVYITLGAILSFSVLFNITNIVPNALLYKQKQFKKIGLINISINIVVGCVTIYLAISGWSYYALIFDSVIKSILIFILCFFVSDLKLFRGFKISSIKKIKSYSMYQFSFNFINYFTRNLDNILTGKFLGEVALAYYDKSYKLMLYPIQNLTHVITPVLHPFLSEYQDDKESIYNTYIKVVKGLSYIGVFVSVFCFFSSKEIIYIMYGEKWANSIPVFKILSISIVIQMVLSTAGSIFQATGYVNKLFSTGVVSAIFTISAIAIGLISGSIVTLAIGVVISFIINFVQSFYVLITKVFNKSYLEFLLELKHVITIGAIMSIAYMVTAKFGVDNILLSAIIKFIIGMIGYVIGLVITKEYKIIKNILF